MIHVAGAALNSTSRPQTATPASHATALRPDDLAQTTSAMTRTVHHPA
jgi:hypothetical protein